MTKVKTPSDYSYYYPVNVELAKHLHLYDLTRISVATGYSRGHLTAIFKGRRKMPYQVLEEFIKLCPTASKLVKEVPIIPIKSMQNT